MSRKKQSFWKKINKKSYAWMVILIFCFVGFAGGQLFAHFYVENFETEIETSG
jgi:hypothetical protein